MLDDETDNARRSSSAFKAKMEDALKNITEKLNSIHKFSPGDDISSTLKQVQSSIFGLEQKVSGLEDSIQECMDVKSAVSALQEKNIHLKQTTKDIRQEIVELNTSNRRDSLELIGISLKQGEVVGDLVKSIGAHVNVVLDEKDYPCYHQAYCKEALTPGKVREFLTENPSFLEDYILEQVDLELLERWIIRKTQRALKRAQSTDAGDRSGRKTSLSRWKFCVHADKRKMLQALTSSLYLKPQKGHVLSELARTICSAVNADHYRLHIYSRETLELTTYRTQDGNSDECNGFLDPEISNGQNIASYVAEVKEVVRMSADRVHDFQFSDGSDVTCDVPYVLCHPIFQPDGELEGVLELIRKDAGPEFFEEDEEIVNSYLVWGGIAIHYAELYSNMARQRKLNNFLLAVVKSIFQDMVSMDTVIVKIMTFAQKLVSADRASLFLVDGRSKELYARIFDVSGEGSNTKLEASKEIRFPIGTGIAGFVAQSGQSLNIPNAYDDDRFNRSVDQQTGYTTKNLLCMPIFIRGSVIGVVQMVNKISSPFSKTDEEAFATFATYCGLALHHAKLYDKIRRSEQKYRVALEVLAYHNTCTDEEFQRIESEERLHDSHLLCRFEFSPLTLNDNEKVLATIYMFKDLFGLKRFDLDSLIRFTLTVKKNYRRVPYHNWRHGFSVANSIYAILKSSTGVFRPLEELSLFVSCLCHDLDHRGKTNQFLVHSASPLAAIYTTSTLEHHHFNQTVAILQQEGHNIFKNLSPDEYKQVLGNIKHCILATDLALFFPNKGRLKSIVDSQGFDWNDHEHRLLLQAIAMTSCDLCASTKPWAQQVETVNVIFEEFYDQGDAERAQGREPIPMMDRTKKHEQPASQVGFLRGICIPCYELMAEIIPQTRPMLQGVLDNLHLWQELVDEQNAEVQKSIEQNPNSKDEEVAEGPDTVEPQPEVENPEEEVHIEVHTPEEGPET